jgi:hypothetical protein
VRPTPRSAAQAQRRTGGGGLYIHGIVLAEVGVGGDVRSHEREEAGTLLIGGRLNDGGSLLIGDSRCPLGGGLGLQREVARVTRSQAADRHDADPQELGLLLLGVAEPLVQLLGEVLLAALADGAALGSPALAPRDELGIELADGPGGSRAAEARDAVDGDAVSRWLPVSPRWPCA